MNLFIRTKFERPQRVSEHIARPRLMQQLSVAINNRLILVSAPAGYGKTTLMVEWLHTIDWSWAWLSLDQADSDLATFLTCFIAAIQSADPSVCKNSQAILNGPQLPPPDQLTTALINDLAELSKDVILVLDDYQLIKERTVHELLAALVSRCPRHFHLVIATRANPPLPIPQWRAHGHVAEIRTFDLCFTRDEAHAFLKHEIGESVPENVIDDLMALTEGWITGLKLAAISIRDRAMRAGQAQSFSSAFSDIQAARANRHIADYLLDDVFSRQPRAIREFLMRTSILDQFTAPLCDALGPGEDATEAPDGKPIHQARFVLKWLERANLFLVPLDEERHWYRYHHLFRELLRHRLKQHYDDAAIAQLHIRASAWLIEQGMYEDGLHHVLTGGDAQCAADLVEAHRHVLLDVNNWRTLERWLKLLPEDVVRGRPALLMARAWVLHFSSRSAAMKQVVQEVARQLDCADAADESVGAMNGEIKVFMSLTSYQENQFEDALTLAGEALRQIPPTCAYARGVAAIILGLCSQAVGRKAEGGRQLEAMFNQDPDRGSPAALRALLTQAWMACVSGEWEQAQVAATLGLKLANQKNNELLAGWAYLFLGLTHYQWNDLDHATEYFSVAVQSRYSLNQTCASSCLIGLSMSYWAQGNEKQSLDTNHLLAEFALEAQSPGLMLESQAFRAHLALLQNNVALALHWALEADARDDQRLLIYPEAPTVTRARAFVADGSAASLDTAAPLLHRALAFARATHNVWREVELLALQALALRKQAQPEASLDALEHALALAKPGHFVRTLLDLGQELAPLLGELVRQGRQIDYAGELLAGLTPDVRKLDHAEATVQAPANGHVSNGNLIEPLTNREMEILTLMAQHHSNDEIAQALFISPLTVKSHTRNLFDKLGVARRRYAIQRARELGVLPPA